MLPYRIIQHSSDCDERFTSCWKHARGGFGNLKKFKNCTSRSTRCCPFPTGAYTVHPIATKFSQVIVNMLAVVLEIKNLTIVLAGVPSVCPTGAHSVHPIAMKLPQVVGNLLAVVLELKKIKKCTSWSIWCCPTFRS